MWGWPGVRGNAILFVKGEVIKKVSPEEAVDALMEEVDKLVGKSGGDRQ